LSQLLCSRTVVLFPAFFALQKRRKDKTNDKTSKREAKVRERKGKGKGKKFEKLRKI
jgi:hypothetical protein